MARLKKRKIYGIDDTSLDGNTPQFNINFGEGRFAIISYKSFIENVATWTGCMNVDGRDIWVYLLRFADYFNGSYMFRSTAGQFIKLASEGRHEIEGEVIHFKNGDYLLEQRKYVKTTIGRIKYVNIKSFKKYTIKYNTNGIDGFSIWKGKNCFEDSIWSIAHAQDIIIEMKKC